MLAMGRTGIKKLVLKKEGVELQLEREERAPCRTFDSGDLQALEENPMRGEIERHRASSPVVGFEPEKKPAVEDENALFVTSPMVGTFYRSPSPNDPPFVKAGDRIEKNTVVCIIEAMKVMNEVKADVSGTVAECLIYDRHPVEFGTKLYRVLPTM
jgi:acetyl-CoA carboxylase biotin carboxyl carrier protein